MWFFLFPIGTSISGLVRLFWLLLRRGFHGFQVGLFLFCNICNGPGVHLSLTSSFLLSSFFPGT
jgi:hypothetical protein